MDKAFAGTDPSHLLRHEGELQPGGDQDHGRHGRGHGRGERRRTPPRLGRRRAGAQDRLLGVSPRRRARWRLPSRKASPVSTSSRSRNSNCSRRWRPASASAPASRSRQSRCRRQDPRQDHDGKADNKFGIPYLRASQVYARAASLPSIDVAGIDMHIGSQITELAPFEKAYTLMAELARKLLAEGHSIRHLDLGGGLGVPYRGDNDIPPHPDEYGAMCKRVLGPSASSWCWSRAACSWAMPAFSSPASSTARTPRHGVSSSRTGP